MSEKQRGIKLVVCDMDGTFLGPGGSTCPKAVESVQRLKRAGIPFTFITGRPRSAVVPFAEALELSLPVVACNGALIFRGEETYFRRSFPVAPLQELIEQALAAGLTVVYSYEDIEYAVSETHWTRTHTTKERSLLLRPIAPEEWGQMLVEKVNVFAREDGSGFAELVPLLRLLRERYSISLFGFTGCEIVAAEMNKAIGLTELCKLLNISLAATLAIGDNSNDNEMLKLAGIGCAVRNAPNETKQCADYICTQSYGEGVAEAIEHFLFS